MGGRREGRKGGERLLPQLELVKRKGVSSFRKCDGRLLSRKKEREGWAQLLLLQEGRSCILKLMTLKGKRGGHSF